MPTIQGDNNDNILVGGAGDDVLIGAGGNDMLDGGAGNDVLRGETGNDLYLVDDSGDRVIEVAGEGNDTVYASVNFALEAGAEVEALRARNESQSLALNLTGNDFAQTLAGNAGANILSGGGGIDYLDGRGGDDLLDGGSGADILRGGSGNDHYIVDALGDRVLEAAGEGHDAVFSDVTFALEAGAQVEELRLRNEASTTALNLTGNEFGQVLAGNAGANILNGGGGDDYLDGRGGNDTLDGGTGNDVARGGSGNDLYLVDDAGDRVLEAAGEGSDTLFTSVTFSLEAGSHVEELRARNEASTAALNITGNEIGQILAGSAGANILSGGGGDDYLDGRGGNDLLDGGSGSDVARGGAGDDTYFVDHANDRVLEAAGEGYDTVFSDVGFALEGGAQVEELRLRDDAAMLALNLNGNEFGQIIVGNAGANLLNGLGGDDYLDGRGGDDSLDGGTGNDVARGGVGNDTFVVDAAGDRAIEAVGEGSDTLLARASFALEAGSEIEALRAADAAATTALNLTGNEFGQLLVGNAGANVLGGGGGNDQLIGGDGDDRLEGGLGGDTLTGGAGSDLFVFGDALGGNLDMITDFNNASDRFVLNGDAGSPFAMLATGPLAPGAFVYGAVAGGPSTFIRYDPSTGALSFDADGSGALAAVEFARITPYTTLNAGHFTVSGAADRLPVFSSGGTAAVSNNAPASTLVYQAQASDPDGDAFFYSLSGVDAGAFTIDSSGAVRLRAPTDNQVQQTYNFSVLAGESNGAIVARAVTLTVEGTPNVTPYVVSESASNDTRAEAMALDRKDFRVATNANLANDDLPSATINGTISTIADRDFFSLTLNAGEQIILDIDGTSSLDALVRVYDANGVELAMNDDAISFDTGSTAHTGVSHNLDSLIRLRVPSTGTYYFSVESYDTGGELASTGAYALNVSIAPPATAAQLVEEDIQALLSGNSWSSLNVSYSFPTSASQYATGEATDELPTFQTLLPVQQTVVRQVLTHAASLTNLVFTENVASPGSAQMRYARSQDGETAHAYYPGPGPGGDSWYHATNGDYDNPVIGNYAYATFVHETGHALGLRHGHESPSLSPAHDSLEYSVMTYRSYVGAPVGEGEGYTNEAFGYPQTFMMYDIAALQRMYGADFGNNSGNSVYSWNPSNGAFSINGATQWTPGGNRVFMTIWDGGGNDTYDLSNYTAHGTLIDLRPGQWSLFSNVQLANLGNGNQAEGNVANALQYNNDPRSLIENAIGTINSDTIIGNAAANRLTGGASGDTFRFESLDQSSRAAPDIITDFTRSSMNGGIDMIDLSRIDANAFTSGDDAFQFIDTGAFSGAAGQLRYERVGADSVIYADVDGDRVADFQLTLLGVSQVTTDYFVL